MKKLLSSFLLLATLAVAFTGCLKDKGFDNRTYGINDPDTQPPGVGFPLATNAKNTVGLDAGSATNQAVNNIVFINLLSGVTSKSDVHVTLVVNDALRTAYNTANATNILAIPPALYNMSLNLTIPAGSTGAGVTVNVPSTVPMDPSSSYGLGLTISSVDGGYKIAQNLKNIFIEFTLKNRYDGNYKMDIQLMGWAAYGIADGPAFYTWPSNTNGSSIYMVTGGPNTARIYNTISPFVDFYQPGVTSTATFTVFGDTAPRLTFDLATNKLVAVSNDIAPFAPRNRDFRINPAVVAPAGNYYDPGAKKIYASYIFSQSGRPDQFISEIFTYRGPRP